MAKYVEFNIPDKDSVYYKVEDFDLETIKNLPIYKDKWFSIICLEGEPRYYEGEILDIYPGEIIKKIYYGKKISYEKVKEIIGNDVKYGNLLADINMFCRIAYGNYRTENNVDDEYNEGLEDFIQKYDQTHYCLFTMPDRFGAEAFFSENAITIEEFDSSIKLDYNNQLEAIRFNSMAGEEYMEKHKLTLEMFKSFFNVLCASSTYFLQENYDDLFSLIQFNFEYIEGINSIEDIKFFLEVFAYSYNNVSYHYDLFKAYKDYIIQKYDEDLSLS